MTGADIATVVTAIYGAVVATAALLMEVRSRRELRKPNISVALSFRRAADGSWEAVVDVVNRGPRDVRLVLVRLEPWSGPARPRADRNLADEDVPRLVPSDAMRIRFAEGELVALGFDVGHYAVTAHVVVATGEGFQSLPIQLGHERAVLEADFLAQSKPRYWLTTAAEVMSERQPWERERIALTARRLELGRHLVGGGMLLAGAVSREEVANCYATIKSLQLATGELTLDDITHAVEERRRRARPTDRATT